MDEGLLGTIFPHLITFSSISVVLLISLPTLRSWLKEQFDRKLADDGMRGTEFFRFQFYITITNYLEYIAVIYLVGIFLILLSPLQPTLRFISYGVIGAATAALVVHSLIAVFSSIRKSLASTTIPGPRLP